MELLLNGIIQLWMNVIDVKDVENALDALMFVLAIDAEKCTRNKRQNN